MKNNKQQKQISNKRRRLALYLGLGLGLSGIVAGSAAAIAIKLNHSHSIPKNKVLFNAGTDHIFESRESTKLIDCSKATALIDMAASLRVYNKNNVESVVDNFVGWAYTSDFNNGKVAANKIIAADTKIKPQSSITAVYTSTVADEGISWKTVSFERGSSVGKVTITGNTKFKVIAGTCLREVNTPECNPTSTGEMKFVGWKKKGETQQFSENTPINSNLVLEPILSAAAKITFVADTHSTITGKETLTIVEGTMFSDINTPQVEPESGYVFAGWYKDSAKTTIFPPTEQIRGEDTKIYAKVVTQSEAETNMTIVNAVDVTGVTYEGNTKFAIARNAIWSQYNRPIPKAEKQKITHWEWSLNGTSDWKIAESTTQFGDVSAAYIRPHLESTISSVVITSSFNSLPKNQATKIEAMVLPSTSTQTVTWALFSDPECEHGVTSGATIDANGNLLVEDGYTGDTIYVQATSTEDTTKKGSKGFTFANPYENSGAFWLLNTGSISGLDNGWYSIENLDTAAGTDIQLYKYGETTSAKSIARADFNYPIHVGSEVTYLGNFLYGCNTFNSAITFHTPSTKTIRIGDNFMAGCAAFNPTEEEWDLTNVASVGNNFLYGAIAFAKKIKFGDNLGSIGENFLKDNTTFNATITLGSSIETIRYGFLEGCSAFTQDITLPASLKSVESHFMYQCNGYTGKITAECAGTVFDKNVENLSAKSNQEAIYATGFTVDGAGKNSFPYTTLDGTSSHGCFRTNKSERKVDSITVDATSATKEFTVGETFHTSGLVVKAKYLDPEETVEVNDYTTNWDNHKFTATDVGDLTVTVSYGGKTATYGITVKAAADIPEYLTATVQADQTLEIAYNTAYTGTPVSSIEIKSTYKVDGSQKTVTSIAESGFKGLDTLTSITLPSTLTTIGANALSGTHITSLTIPAATVTLGAGFIAGYPLLTSLTGITFEDTTSTWKYGEEGSLKDWTPSKTASENLNHFQNDEGALSAHTKQTTVEELPKYLTAVQQDDGSIWIGASTEEGAPELPENLTIASKYIFNGKERAVTGLIVNAFWYDVEQTKYTQIKSITLPNTLVTMSQNALNGTAISSLTIPASVKTIEEGCLGHLESNKLTEITFADTESTWSYMQETTKYTFKPSKTPSENATHFVTDGNYQFTHTKVEAKDTLPEYLSLTERGELSFKEEKTLPTELEGALSIAPYYVTGGEIVRVITLDDFSKAGTDLKSVTIGEGVETIHGGCFSSNTSLASVTIPATMKTIESNALATAALASLTFANPNITWEIGSPEKTYTPGSNTPAENAAQYKTSGYYNVSWGARAETRELKLNATTSSYVTVNGEGEPSAMTLVPGYVYTFAIQIVSGNPILSFSLIDSNENKVDFSYDSKLTTCSQVDGEGKPYINNWEYESTNHVFKAKDDTYKITEGYVLIVLTITGTDEVDVIPTASAGK